MIAAIESAIASIAASVPDASAVMRQGDSRGVVVAASSRELTGETLTADAPQEMRRVIGRRCDFPHLTKGCAVRLGDDLHIVTSARTDPVGASVTVGVSASLNAVAALYRRAGTAIRQSVNALAVESDVLDAWADAIAPTSCRAWFVAFPAPDWIETTDPQIGDEIWIDETQLRVSVVAKHDGYWLLTCRARR